MANVHEMNEEKAMVRTTDNNEPVVLDMMISLVTVDDSSAIADHTVLVRRTVEMVVVELKIGVEERAEIEKRPVARANDIPARKAVAVNLTVIVMIANVVDLDLVTVAKTE